MATQSADSPVRRFFTSRLFLFVAIPLALLVGLGCVRSYYSGYKINQEILTLKSEINSLEHKKLESMEILNYVMSRDFVEEKARTELNMKKEGENVLIVKNNNVYNSHQFVNSYDSRQKVGNPIKWWYYFIDKKQIQINN
jgi:cell division protein FtsL